MTLAAQSALIHDLHSWWAWVVVLSNGAAGLWALGAHRFEGLRHRALWWFTAAAQTSIVVQVVLGISMLEGERSDAVEFHMFYGFIALFAAAIIYAYRQQLTQHRYLLYGLGSLFIMGLCIRAMFLDPF